MRKKKESKNKKQEMKKLNRARAFEPRDYSIPK